MYRFSTLPPPPRHAAGCRRKPVHGLRELPPVRRRDATSAPRAGAELLGGPEDARVVPAESVLRRVVVRLEPNSVLDCVGPRPDLAVSHAEIPVRDLPRARAPSLVLCDAGARDSPVHPGPRYVRDRGGRDRSGGSAAQGAARPAAERPRHGRRARRYVTPNARA